MNLRPEALASEVQLDADIVPTGAFAPVTRPQAVFVTGGTGFLGAFVIADLLRLTQARIYCLVRAADAVAAKQRLLQNLQRYGLSHTDLDSRVIAVAGDVEQPRFNLDQPAYERLAEQVEVVYHLAASVSFMPGYDQLKAVNVGGLKHVLRFACARRTKAVHYTSTYAVFNADAYELASTVYENRLTGSSDGFGRGYDRSKWIAEQVVRIAQERGIPVNVYRAGFISGDSHTGVHNKMDPVAQIFAVALCTGLVFRIEALLHLTPVDFCSNALVRLSLNPATANQIFHLVQEQPLTCMEVVSWLQGEGYDLQYVGLAEWNEQLKILARSNPMFVPAMYLFSKQKPFGEGENISSLQFDAANVHRYLEPVYRCPSMHSALLRRYFDYLTSADRGYDVRPRLLSTTPMPASAVRA
jgi:thioester reductase-like protein